MIEEKAQQLIVLASAVTIGSTTSGLLLYPKPIAERRKKLGIEEAKRAGTEQAEVLEGKKKKIENPPAVVNLHRAIVGGFFAMAGCSIIAMFAPDAGVGLAAMVAGGAFFFYGLPVLDSYFEPEKEKKKK